MQQQKAEWTKTRRERLESCATAVEICNPALRRPSCSLPSPERTSLQHLSFFFALSSRYAAKKGLPSRQLPRPSALAARHNLSKQSSISRDLTPASGLSTAAEPCLTSLRLLPETSHSDAFACRNARQQTLKACKSSPLLSLFASKQTSPPRHPNPTLFRTAPYTTP